MTLPSPGERVRISTKKGSYEGTLLPSEDETVIVLKLTNGYNIGIFKKDVDTIKTLAAKKIQAAAKEPVEKPSVHSQTISILHTGGTIASRVDYATGGAKHNFTPQQLIKLFPELGKLANIKSRLVAQMWSEDMRFSHYNLLAQEIAKEVKAGVDGIIIGHGTDSLGYTAAALSFLLQHLPIPVVLVGAQRSSDRGSSDAGSNLLAATNYILQKKRPGVVVCLHEASDDKTCSILSGINCRKMSSTRRDAFKPINRNLVGRVDLHTGIVTLNEKEFGQPKKPLVLTSFREDLKIGLLYAHPHMWAEELKNYEAFDGLIIAGMGLGHIGINKTDSLTGEGEKIGQALTTLTKRMPVVMTSQTLFGRVCLDVYTTGRREQEMGVIGNGLSLTPETAFIKLAWAISQTDTLKDAKALYLKDVLGEFQTRTPYSFM